MSQSTSSKKEQPAPEQPNAEEVELKECSFLVAVKLSRSTSHQIWTPAVDFNTKMFLDFGGLPKLVLRKSDTGEVLRYIPYHCLKDFELA